jgi:hypothetical protein
MAIAATVRLIKNSSSGRWRNHSCLRVGGYRVANEEGGTSRTTKDEREKTEQVRSF